MTAKEQLDKIHNDIVKMLVDNKISLDEAAAVMGSVFSSVVLQTNNAGSCFISLFGSLMANLNANRNQLMEKMKEVPKT